MLVRGYMGVESYCLMGQLLFGKIKYVLQMDGSDGCTVMGTYLVSLNNTIKIITMANFVMYLLP